MRCRIPSASDVPALMSYMPSVQADPVLAGQMERTLLWTAVRDNACGQASFARIIQVGDITGHISANLIFNGVADNMEHRRDKRFLFEPEVNEPLKECELREQNSSSGSCLLLTSFFWNQPDPYAAQQFGKVAFDHLTRWFEGNRIDSFAFFFRSKYEDRFEGLIRSLSESMVRRSDFDTGDTFIRVQRPWHPRGIAPDWIERLLLDYPEPTTYLPDNLKQVGRIFHEFRFNLEEAVPGCFPTWVQDIDNLKRNERSRNADAFSRRVSKALDLNPNRNERDIMRRVQRLFELNPRVLTLYHCSDKDAEPSTE